MLIELILSSALAVALVVFSLVNLYRLDEERAKREFAEWRADQAEQAFRALRELVASDYENIKEVW